MRTIAHISDLHFGAEEADVAQGLREDLNSLAPSLVVVSGDLTQRAKLVEFRAARQFLNTIPTPQLIVPGNHDIPLHNVFLRMFRPLKGYRKWITGDMSPLYQDDELAVLGINTARSLTFKNGRISLAQIELMQHRLCGIDKQVFKVLVTHHPFIPPQNDPAATMVGRRHLALKTLAGCGCELLLSGHLHMADNGDVRTFHIEVKRSIMVAQAGTAISHRRRGEPNSYNLMTIQPPHFTLQVRTWNGTRFAPTLTTEYLHHEGHGWRVSSQS